MGRMTRQRKYKACDPFNKKSMHGAKKLNDKYDKPLTKEQIKEDYHFADKSKFKTFQAVDVVDLNSSKKGGKVQKNKGKGDKAKVLKGKEKMREIVNSSKQLPGESTKDMFRRLDQNIHNAMNEAMKENKTIRKKRKEHLKARDEKMKNKKSKSVQVQNQQQQQQFQKQKQQQQEQDDTDDDDDDSKPIKDFDSFKDNVKFGETVYAPPEITAVPRKAQKNKEKTLHLHSLFKKETSVTASADDKTDKPKRRRDMDDVEKGEFDGERQRAIDAYRLAKKRREMRKT